MAYIYSEKYEFGNNHTAQSQERCTGIIPHVQPLTIFAYGSLLRFFYCKETSFLDYFPVYLRALHRCFICISAMAR